jgi:hypothetical protein
VSPPDRDDFNDLPILADLRAQLEARFSRPASRAQRAARRGLGLVPVLIATGTAIAVVVLALTVIRPGHAQHNAPAAPVHHPPQLPPKPSPNPSPAQSRDIDKAQHAVIERDPACRVPVNRGQTVSGGSPGPAILSRLGVMRRPAPPRDAAWRTLFNNGWDIGAEVDVNYIREARIEYGKAYFLIPEGHTTPFGPIPSRCYAEMRTALERALRHVSPRQRALTLAQQAEQFSVQRTESSHRAGLCFAAVSLHHKRRIGGVDMGCSPGAQDFGPDLTGGIGERDRAGGTILAAIVPDGVASVTLRFAAGTGDPARAITSKAINNVVAFKIPPHTAHHGFPTEVIRRAADGHIIDTSP